MNLLISRTNKPGPLLNALGPEWKVCSPGSYINGRFDLILAPIIDEPEYETWLKEVIICRLSSPEAQLLRI